MKTLSIGLLSRSGNSGSNESDGFFCQSRRRPSAVWGIRQGAATTYGGKRRCFMFRYFRFAALVVSVMFFSAFVHAKDSLAPWGSATEIDQVYSKQKVVFDTAAGSIKGMTSVLDRVSYMNKLNGGDSFDTKIVVVLHGPAVQFFTSKNFTQYKELMVRAQSLTAGDVVEFRMCKASALLMGLSAKDIHGFVKMVPMADAEIVRLQQEENFGYMQ